MLWGVWYNAWQAVGRLIGDDSVGGGNGVLLLVVCW